MREQYNSDSRNTQAPFVVAMFGSLDENFNTHAPNHYLKIEEHGYDIYGSESTTLYDLTGFYSKIYDLQFTEDCSTAVFFMQTTEKNPVDRSAVSSGDVVTVITELDLEDPGSIID